MDISKAFDRVSHEDLLHKLETLGIAGNIFTYFKVSLIIDSEVNGHRQRQMFQTVMIRVASFLNIPNDLTDNLESLAKLFTDDFSWFRSVCNISLSAGLINDNMKSRKTSG